METATQLLLERDDESAELSRATRAASQNNGRILLFAGPAGIGKTAMIDAARVAAQEASMRVLTARGGELERDFGFGVVGQLFENAIRAGERSSLFAGPARLAAPILGLSGPADPMETGGGRILAALHGLYWLTANLSEERPIAMLVDDAHWADSASIRFLAHLGHRMEGLPVLVVLAARAGADREQIERVLPTAKTFQVQPLSRSGTSALVRSVAPSADDDVCRACHAATGGNAFFALELARALRAEGAEAGRGRAERLLEWSPARVTRSVNTRLAALSPTAQALARAAAVLGQGAELRHAAAVAEITVDLASQAADELSAAGILSPLRPLEFVHPIVRAAVYDELRPGARSRAHGRAAALLADEQASAERVAVHVMHCERAGDPIACRRLVDGAREASERGAPEAAVSCLRCALAEPPPPKIKNAVLIELATAEGLTFAVDSAAGHLRRAFETMQTRVQRLHVALLVASLASHNARAEEAMEPLARARAEFVDQPSITASIDAHIANTARFEREARALALPISRRLRALADSELPADATVLAAVVAERAMAGDPWQRVAAAALRGLELARSDRRLIGGVDYLILVRTLIVADRLEEVGGALESWLQDSRRRGSALDYAFASLFRADLMYRWGDVFEAEADSRSAYAFALEHQWPVGWPVIGHHMLNSLIERGELAEAESMLAATGLNGAAADQPGLYTSNLLLFARGRLRAAGDEPDKALEDLLECGRRQDDWQETNPALIPWRSEAALAYRSVGETDLAQQLAVEEVELARSFGAPRALGIALRAAGLVNTDGHGLELLREAAEVLSESAARLEYARVLADLGDTMRVAGATVESRDVLRKALELANTCGATALEARLLAALRAAGARPRRARLSGPEALTPSERRVTRMAAEGLTNREIAESLFVTVRTVEFHLRSAYRKLRIERPGASSSSPCGTTRTR